MTKCKRGPAVEVTVVAMIVSEGLKGKEISENGE